MKALLLLVLMTGAIGSWRPALAQVPADPPTVWRLGGARSTTPTGPGRVKEVAGVLVSDSAGKQLRLDAAGRALFVVPYARITAMHYEQADYPRRFLRRSSFYVAIHYLDVAGLPAFETIRLLSKRDALAALATLERDTGLTVDRSLTAQSFLGVPIRARVGARVAVTDQSGQTTEGVIAQLSPSSLTLDESTGVPRILSEASLRKIRLLYSPKHDALVGLGTGAAVGAFGVWVSAGLGGCFSPTGHSGDCHVPRVAAAVAAVGGGLGALMGMTIGAVRYPFSNAFDVYRGDLREARRLSLVTIAPQVSQARKGVIVLVRF
jgi:hypothetical protein